MWGKAIWRKRVEIDEDLKKLASLQDSEAYKLWTKKIRQSIREDLLCLFQTDLRQKADLLFFLERAKIKYDMLVMIPNEMVDFESEMNQVEEEEKRLVQEGLRRGTRRQEGSV